MKKKFTQIETTLLLAIVLAGFFFRFYSLGEIPPGLHRDEASSGYNAYLLLNTGRDEHEQLLPLVFKAFGDWKRPINIYLTALSVYFFGLNEFATRAPIAFFGVLSILVIFLLTKEFFDEKIALTTAFIFTISPWHIFMSRTGLGWNIIGLFLTLTALYFYFKKKKNVYDLSLSAVFFGLSLFSYASNQIFTPLLLFLIFICDWKNIVKSKKNFIAPLIIFMLFFMIFVKVYFPVFQKNSPGASFFDNYLLHAMVNIPRGESSSVLLGKILHNKFIAFEGKFVENYLKILSPQFFLFNREDNPSYSLLNFGNFYIFEVPLMILGWIFMFQRKRQFSFLFLWFFLAIVPGALTKNPYSSTRVLNMLPPIAMATAYGIHKLFDYFKSKRLVVKRIYLISIVGLYVLSVTMFSDEYFVHFPINRSSHWGSAQKDLVSFLQVNENKYSQIIISHPEESFYIYLAFYEKYSSDMFWKNVKRYPETRDGFSHVEKIGKYQFRRTNYPDDFKTPGRLLVDKTTDVTAWSKGGVYNTFDEENKIEVRIIKLIKHPDGSPAYTIFETLPSNNQSL